MKITIEPTVNKDGFNNTISVSNDDDDITLDRTMDLIKYALLAWGFSQETIDRYYEDK